MRYDQRPIRPIVLGGEGACMVADIANLHEQYPKAWLADGDSLDIQLCPRLDAQDYEADPITSDRLYYYLREGLYRFHAGVSKTHEIYLGFPAGGVSAGYRPWHHAAACRALASWYAGTAAAGRMTPRRGGRFQAYDTSLDLYNRYARDQRVDETIVRAARWLARDEWVKEKQGFRATSCPSFNASTPAGGACWSCANAMLIAHRLTGERQFLDIARCGFAHFIRRAQESGKGVTQSMVLGPETLWRFEQLGITSLDSPR
jgi:hypothetical protein